jgi:hypothetical protein
MLHYKRMTIFQNLDRTRTLVTFKKLIEMYFANVDRGAFGLEATENVIAKRTRSQLNLRLEKVKMALYSVETYPTAPHQRRTAAYEPSGEIDLVENIFSLKQQKVDPQTLVDHVERAIGMYTGDRFNASLRTLNPLYWLSILVNYTARLPFFILGSMGLNRDRLEGSTLGKVFKGFFRVAVFLAILVGVIHYLGFLGPLKSRAQELFTHLKLNSQEVIHQLEQRTDELILKLQGSSPESKPEDQDPAT